MGLAKDTGMSIGTWRRTLKAEAARVAGPNVSFRGPWSTGGDGCQLAIGGSYEAALPAPLALQILRELPDEAGPEALLVAWYARPEHDERDPSTQPTDDLWVKIISSKRERLGIETDSR